MAHHVTQSGYNRLVERLNRFPQGAYPSEPLYKILAHLFTVEEASLVAQLPIKPFSVNDAARIWGKPDEEAGRILDHLADKALLLDIAHDDGTVEYVLPPPMAGFFEFTLMRVRDDLDQRLLAELYHQYVTVEDGFLRDLMTDGVTRMGRVFAHEDALEEDQSLHVLDYERASGVIRSAMHRSVGMCYCRHKMRHLDKACDAPMDICMTFNTTAAALTRHGHAREAGVEECLDLLDQARAEGLVQFGENAREGCGFICHCCGCCCEALIAARRFGVLHPIHTSNFLPVVDAGACTGCGKCVRACPVEAMALVSANDPHKPARAKVKVDTVLCLGCGVCARPCPSSAIRLEARGERVITPLNSVHKAVSMAIERGRLQHLLFDNSALWSHRAMSAVLGVILNLPPLKRAMASKQMRSRYLERLLALAGR